MQRYKIYKQRGNNSIIKVPELSKHTEYKRVVIPEMVQGTSDFGFLTARKTMNSIFFWSKSNQNAIMSTILHKTNKNFFNIKNIYILQHLSKISILYGMKDDFNLKIQFTP